METKWEWIASEVRKLGYPNLAKMALVIDKHIAEIYGKGKVTESWGRCYDYISGMSQTPELVWDVINESIFCYPCYHSIIRQLACGDCEYGHKHGVCSDTKSEFNIFRRIFNTIFWV